MREAQRRHEDPIAAILGVEPGKLLYQGKVADVERRTTEGFLRGRTRFDGLDAWRQDTMTINFQNEWIVAWINEKPVAMSPDLICVLDSVSGEAIGTETIRYGQRVTVIALPPPEVFFIAEGPGARRPGGVWLRHSLSIGVPVMRRIGIDVGGTNTDAVLIDDGQVVRAVKAPTSEDVTAGILAGPGATAGRARRAGRG